MGHANSRLTPFGRRLLVDRVMVWGWSVAAGAGAHPRKSQSGRFYLRQGRPIGVDCTNSGRWARCRGTARVDVGCANRR